MLLLFSIFISTALAAEVRFSDSKTGSIVYERTDTFRPLPLTRQQNEASITWLVKVDGKGLIHIKVNKLDMDSKSLIVTTEDGTDMSTVLSTIYLERKDVGKVVVVNIERSSWLKFVHPGGSGSFDISYSNSTIECPLDWYDGVEFEKCSDDGSCTFRCERPHYASIITPPKAFCRTLNGVKSWVKETTTTSSFPSSLSSSFPSTFPRFSSSWTRVEESTLSPSDFGCINMNNVIKSCFDKDSSFGRCSYTDEQIYQLMGESATGQGESVVIDIEEVAIFMFVPGEPIEVLPGEPQPFVAPTTSAVAKSNICEFFCTKYTGKCGTFIARDPKYTRFLRIECIKCKMNGACPQNSVTVFS